MIVIGELDTDGDNNFSGLINHAKGSIKYRTNSWSQKVFTFESTDGFPISDFASEEDYAELISGIEALGLENDVKSMEKTLLVMQILAVVMGATAVYIPARKIASVVRESRKRKKRKDKLKELQTANNRVNKLVVSKIVTSVSGLDMVQLSWLPQYLNILINAGKQYAGDNEKLSVDQLVSSVKYMNVTGIHQPSLKNFSTIKSSLSYLFSLSRNSLDIRNARIATNRLLSDSEIPQENMQVLKVIDILFKLRWR